MNYLERVKIGYKWCPNPFVYTMKALSDIPSALTLAVIGVPLFIWVLIKLVLSPLRWVLEPLWFAFKLRGDESVWTNMKGIIDSSEKKKANEPKD